MCEAQWTYIWFTLFTVFLFRIRPWNWKAMFSFANDEDVCLKSSTPISGRRVLQVRRSSPFPSASPKYLPHQVQALYGPVGRPLTVDDNTPRRRSLPPGGLKSRSSQPNPFFLGSHQGNHDNPRRSLPKLNEQGQSVESVPFSRHAHDIRGRSVSWGRDDHQSGKSGLIAASESPTTPYLWSVHEETSNHVEPMDISPIKVYDTPDYQASTSDCSMISDPGRSQEVTDEPPEKHSGKKVSKFRCGFVKMVLAILAIAVGAALVGLFSKDMYSYWSIHKTSMNITQMNLTLNQQVFGQHIALNVLPMTLDAYLQKDTSQYPKSLVISFHGWTGVGKNFVSYIIGNHLRGRMLKKLILPHDYPQEYGTTRKKVAEHILSQVCESGLNIFLIDGIDKSTKTVLNGIIDAIFTTRSRTFDMKSTKIIYLLLSNTGATNINKFMFDELLNGRTRETVTQNELVDILVDKSKHDESFWWFTKMMSTNVIDVVVPFLPLEKVHVEACIRADLRAKRVARDESTVQQVLQEVTFLPNHKPLFSKSGCKNVPVKVDLTIK